MEATVRPKTAPTKPGYEDEILSPETSPVGPSPRRNSVHPYQPIQLELDQHPPDYMSLLSLMLGLLAYLLEGRFAAWLGLFCMLSSFANLKSSAVDCKQILCSIVCVLMGFFASYGFTLEIFDILCNLE